MKVEYLGTGAAEGIPALFCQCEYCNFVRRVGGKYIRTRSQVLIDGELSIDFPPDAFSHGAREGVNLSAIKYLLVTHSHMDHFYAHDFILRGYKYGYDLSEPCLEIYGNSEVSEVFFEGVRRELRKEVEPSLKMHTVSAFTPFSCGGYTVVALPASHSSQSPFTYLVEGKGKRILHLCDTGRLVDEVYEYLQGGNAVDLITFDCTFLHDACDAVRRHMGVKDNAIVLERLAKIGLATEKTKKVLTHFSHNARPNEENLSLAERELNATVAYDGMKIEI